MLQHQDSESKATANVANTSLQDVKLGVAAGVRAAPQTTGPWVSSMLFSMSTF